MARFSAAILLILLSGISGNGQRSESDSGAVRRLNREIADNARTLRPLDAEQTRKVRRLLQDRAAHWRKLAAANPAAALESSLALPDASLLEKAGMAGEAEVEGEWEGEFERWIADEDGGRHSEHLALKAGNEVIQLHLAPGAKAPEGCGGVVKVSGKRLGDVAAVREVAVERAASGPCERTGEQQVAAILVNLPDARLPGHVTNASVRSMLFGSGPTLDSYWRENSYGKASAAGEVFGPYELTGSYGCDVTNVLGSLAPLFQAAMAAASKDADLSRFNRFVLVVPPNKLCNYAGYSTLGCSQLTDSVYGARSFIRGDLLNVAILAHEVGHTLGLGHSGALYPPGEPLGRLDVAIAMDEYANPWDVMGGAYCGGEALTGHYAARHKVALGWLGGDSLQTVNASGVYSILPLESNVSGVQALRVKRGPGEDRWLWIEYRKPIGFDASLSKCSSASPFGGVLVYYERVTPGVERRTQLLDFGDSLSIPFNSERKAFAAAMKVGQKWSDPYTELSVEVLSAGDTASIRVSYDRPCATITPTSVQHEPGAQVGTVQVVAPGNCGVSVFSNDPSWISVSGQTTFTGSRTLTYVVNTNLLRQQRTSSISIGRQTLEIVQLADTEAPSPVQVTPSNGSSNAGAAQRFVFDYTDTQGGLLLSEVGGVINTLNSLVGGCYFHYFPATRTLRLYGDDGESWSARTIGVAGTLSNGQCSLNMGTATAVLEGSKLRLGLDITFSAAFAGAKLTYLFARDTLGADSGRKLMGYWTVADTSCSTSGSASAASFVAGGGSGSFQITASGSGCVWSVTGAPAWITVSPVSGTGSGTAGFTVAANTGVARSATLNVAGTSITIQQAAAACSTSATAGATSFAAGGGSSAFQVTANLPSCAWSVTGAPGWITVSPNWGTGSGTAGFTVAANAGAARSATLNAAGTSITIQQAAAACSTSATASATSFAAGAGSGTFQVTANLPSCAWSVTGKPDWITVAQSSGSGGTSFSFTVAANAGGARSATLNVAGSAITIQQAAAAVTPPTGLRFVAITPCRVVDTRAGSGKTGAYGPPHLTPDSTRTIPMASSGCGLPATAKAYAINVTVAPWEPLGYLTVFPAGQPRPLVSTLNSFAGVVAANSSIVAAGPGGALQAYATNPTDMILDVTGYFTDDAAASNLAFYPVTPCRLVDTRTGQGKSGAFGPPSFAANTTRTVPVPQGACGIPATAKAYALNFTVVPPAALGYLSAWPTGQSQPTVSTLNSFEGRLESNGAIVPAGTSGSIQVYTTDPTDVIIDINGYFAPDDGNGLFLETITPCRVADTRSGYGFSGAFGPPRLAANSVRTFPIGGTCSLPTTAGAYAMNVTVSPNGPLAYLTVWPAGSGQPLVSTLNSWDGRVTANATVVKAGTSGGLNLFATDLTEVILDVTGFFRR